MHIAYLVSITALVLLIIVNAVIQTRSRKRTNQALTKLEASQRDLRRLVRATAADIKKLERSQRHLLRLLSKSSTGIRANDAQNDDCPSTPPTQP